MGNNINAVNGFAGIGGSGSIDTRNTRERQAQEEAARQQAEQKSSYDPKRPVVHYVATEAEPSRFQGKGLDAFGKMKQSTDTLQSKLKMKVCSKAKCLKNISRL